MTTTLLDRVRQVQAAASRRMWLYALAGLGTVFVVASVLIGLADYLLHLNSPVAPWFFSAALVALLAVSMKKLLLPLFRTRADPIGTARQIELRIPELGERLSSAVAFAVGGNEVAAGSSELRRVVIADAEMLAGSLDFRTVLDWRAPRRALLLLMAAVVVAGGMICAEPIAAGIAAARLVTPWRNSQWPRRHELAVVDPPARIAVGDNFEVVIIDRHGPLPDDLQFQVRRQTGTGVVIDDRSIRGAGRRVDFRLENVTHSFQYRVSGGDDDTMPWLEVAVVEPPKIVDLRIAVRPPAYTRLPKKVEGVAFSALVGSEVEMRATLDQPVASATLKSASASLTPPSVSVLAGGRELRVPGGGDSWIVAESGALDFELTDAQATKFGGNARIEVRAVEDKPPSISWEAPADYSAATAVAALSVRAVVQDDVGVERVALRFLSPAKSDEERVVELYAAKSPTAEGLFTGGDRQTIRWTWDLTRIAGLSVGDVLSVWISAEDAKPQLTTTAVRRISIISLEELKRRIAARQADVLSQLGEGLRLARQCREQVTSLQTASDESPRRSALEAAQFSLRQVQRILSNSSEGAEGRLAALLEELVANRADGDATGQGLRSQLDQVRTLNGDALPALDQELTEALKVTPRTITPEKSDDANVTGEVGACADAADEVKERLMRARERSEEVVQSLERIVGSLAQAQHLGRIAGDADEIRAEQEALAAKTGELMLKALASAGGQTAADRAAARELGEHELDLARRVDKLQTTMEEVLSRLKADDPAAAAMLEGAVDAARKSAIGGRMRDAAGRLNRFQLGQAKQSEDEALAALRLLVESLGSKEKDGTGTGATKSAETGNETRTGSQEDKGKSLAGGAGKQEAAGAPREGENRVERGSREAEVQEAVARVWGHLPEKVREEMQAAMSEQFLPKYQRLIEEYYRRLAEERPTAPKR